MESPCGNHHLSRALLLGRAALCAAGKRAKELPNSEELAVHGASTFTRFEQTTNLVTASQQNQDADPAALSFGGSYHPLGSVATQRISTVRFLSASQLSLLWKSPWTHTTTLARAFASAPQNRKLESRVLDEAEDDDDGEEGSTHEDDDDAEEVSTHEDEDEFEDEHHIEDDEDEDEDEDEEEMEGQGPEMVKKKIQTKPAKTKPSEQQGRILNEDITAQTIRLVIDGKDHRVVSREEALSYAKEHNLDLVQVDGRAKPPVCKVFDFHREEYRQEQVQKDRKKKKGDVVRLNMVKELRFTSKTEPKDLKMKVEKAKQFMDRGHRVKFVAIFKGSEDEKKKLEQQKMIDEIFPLIEDIAVIEQGPRVEARQAWVMLRHIKFGQVKKKPPKPQPQIDAAEHVKDVKHEQEIDSELKRGEGQREENLQPIERSSPAVGTFSTGRRQELDKKNPSLQGPLGFPSQSSQGSLRYKQAFGGLQGPQMQGSTLGFPGQSLQGTQPPPGSPRYTQPPPGSPIFTRSPQGVAGPQMHSPPPRGPLEGGGPQMQPPSPRGPLERGGPQVQPPPPPGPPRYTPSLEGFEAVQSPKMQVPPPRGPARYTQSLQGSEGVRGAEMQPPPLRGQGFPPQSEQGHPSFPEHPLGSVGMQGPRIFSASPLQGSERVRGPQMQSLPPGSPGFSPQNQYPLSPPERPLGFEVTQGPQMYPAPPRGRPQNQQGYPLSPPIPSLPEHPLGSEVTQSPQLYPGSPRGRGFSPQNQQGYPFSPQIRPASPCGLLNHQGLRFSPSQGNIPAQHAQERCPPPLQGSEGFAARGLPRYPPPPIGQPRYPSPLGSPSYSAPQGPLGQSPPQGIQNFQPQAHMQGPEGYSVVQQSYRRPQGMPECSTPENSQNYGPLQSQKSYTPPQNFFQYAPSPYHGSPDPSQVQFGYPRVPGPSQVPPGSRQGASGSIRYPPPAASHLQPPGQRPPPQSHEGFFIQQEAHGFQGVGGQNYPQTQISQGYPPQRGFPPPRPVVSPPGYPPSRSTPPSHSQGYPPLPESPSEKP